MVAAPNMPSAFRATASTYSTERTLNSPLTATLTHSTSSAGFLVVQRSATARLRAPWSSTISFWTVRRDTFPWLSRWRR